MSVKGKVNNGGMTFEVECDSAADFASIVRAVTTPQKRKYKLSGKYSKAGNSVRSLVVRGKHNSSGKHWTPRDIGIVSKVIDTAESKGRSWGTSAKALKELRARGDNPRRTKAAVSMEIMEIKRFRQGRTDGVPTKLRKILSPQEA